MTVKEVNEKYGIPLWKIYKTLRQYRKTLENHITNYGVMVLDDYAVEVITGKKKADKDPQEVIAKQNSIIAEQAKTIIEKDREINKLRMNYRLLEMKLGTIEREYLCANQN